MKPKTPEEALAFIKDAAEGGNIEFAPDTLCAQLDDEIQQIYAAIRTAEGRVVKRPLWTADGIDIGAVMPLTPEGHVTEDAKAAVRRAGEATPP